MLVVTLTEEISATSMTSPEDAARLAIAQVARAESVEVKSVEVKSVEVLLGDGDTVSGYRVKVEVTREEDTDVLTEPEGGARQSEVVWSRSHPAAPRDESFLELVRKRVLLEELTQEDLNRSDRFLAISPAKRGSGSTDVSENHDRHLFED